MKNIIKRSVTGVYKFTCGNCKSYFEADENEYLVKTGFWVEYKDFGFLKMRTMEVRTPVFVLSCLCPVCKEDAEIEFTSGEPVSEVEVYPFEGI